MSKQMQTRAESKANKKKSALQKKELRESMNSVILNHEVMFQQNIDGIVRHSVIDIQKGLNYIYQRLGGLDVEDNTIPENKESVDTIRLNLLGEMFNYSIDAVELKKSNIHGRGVFASRNILIHEVITFYPADIARYHVDGRPCDKDVSTQMGRIYGKGISEESRIKVETNPGVYDEYKFDMDPFVDITGTPENDKNQNYLGHFINDGAKCSNDPRSIDIYHRISGIKLNCEFCPLNNLHVAVVATKNISKGEEILCSYGPNYWCNKKI